MSLARVAGVGVLAGVLGLAAAACGSARASAPTSTTTGAGSVAPTTTGSGPTTTPSSTAPSTTVAAAPTTTAVPTSPQTSADRAADLLIGAWAAHDQASARTVATAAAVSTLFAAAYPGADATIDRGCSGTFLPIVCTFGEPGGGNAAGAIYELNAVQSGPLWYIQSVTVED